MIDPCGPEARQNTRRFMHHSRASNTNGSSEDAQNVEGNKKEADNTAGIDNHSSGVVATDNKTAKSQMDDNIHPDNTTLPSYTTTSHYSTLWGILFILNPHYEWYVSDSVHSTRDASISAAKLRPPAQHTPRRALLRPHPSNAFNNAHKHRNGHSHFVILGALTIPATSAHSCRSSYLNVTAVAAAGPQQVCLSR